MRSDRRLAAWLLVGLWFLPAPLSGELIERVLASVAGRAVLLSDVLLVESLRGLSRQAALEAVIDERLMLAEATRLPQVALSPEQEDQALAALLASQPAAVALPTAGLRRLAVRQALILLYVELRFQPLVRVSEDALRAAYAEAFGHAAAPPSFEEVAAELELRLVREALDLRIEEWVKELRETADVRYVPDGS